MQDRKLGGASVSAIGLGCMSLSHGYGVRPDTSVAQRVLLQAFDLGHTHFDTATMYGGGHNEELLGNTLMHRRNEFFLASKCGLYPGPDGKRDIDGRPERIMAACDDSLRRLKTDVIDLYYLHRLDRRVPIEDSIGTLAQLVQAGKIKSIGLSEMSAQTIKRAHAVHPIAAIQSEYSLWTRNPEIAVMDTCRELGITFVAFSPLARGFLSATMDIVSLDALSPKDLRRPMPRFHPDAYETNLRLIPPYCELAKEAGCTPAQLALAWLLARDPAVVVIPGTTSLSHLTENAGAADISISPQIIDALDRLINQQTVAGHRYTEGQRSDIDTEDFPI